MQNHAKKRFDNTNVNVMTAIAISAMLIFSVVGMKAFADNVQDDIDASVSSSQTITADDNGLVVKYWIVANSAQGSPSGCDASDGSPVTVKFEVRKDGSTDLTNDVTANPTSHNFNACGNSNTNTKTVTYTSSTPGTYKISVSASDTTGSYNTNPAEFTLTVKPAADTTAPVLSLPDDITEEATGADGAEVTFTATAEDAVDGSVDVTCTPASGSTFPLGTTQVDCSATDNAGNEATGSFSITIQDKTAPTLELPADITEEATSASGADVTYTASANDNIDGPVAIECTPASGSTFPLGTTQVDCSATDNAGNQATGSFNVIVQDTTKPVIQVTSTISNGQEFYFGDVPSAPTCSATDTASGVNSDGCKVSGYSTAVGSRTLIFTATDNAGNTATQQITYKVLAWTIKGFYQPVDMNGVLNTVKGGSTVPLKFEVFKGGTELTDTSAIKTPLTAKKVNCDSGTTLDEIETVASGSTALRYDSTAGQFIYNWQTPKQPNACYDVTVGTQDGSSIVGEFRLR